MKKDSLFTSDRFAGFATILKGGYEMTKGRRMNWLALALASLVLVAATGHFTAARVEAQQGPPTHQAILNSVDAVQTTVNSVESKLDLIPPAWSQILPVADRFQLVMGGAGVLDRETGLVWAQSPETAPYITTTQSWTNALLNCPFLPRGGRFGWRLPTVEELASLIDPTQSNPALPSGHPFSNVQSSVYWSATTKASDPTAAWTVVFGLGGVGNNFKTDTLHVWCMRGGQGVDPQ